MEEAKIAGPAKEADPAGILRAVLDAIVETAVIVQGDGRISRLNTRADQILDPTRGAAAPWLDDGGWLLPDGITACRREDLPWARAIHDGNTHRGHLLRRDRRRSTRCPG